jgi:hypothetical protein
MAQVRSSTPDTLSRAIFLWTIFYAVAFCVTVYVIMFR